MANFWYPNKMKGRITLISAILFTISLLLAAAYAPTGYNFYLSYAQDITGNNIDLSHSWALSNFGTLQLNSQTGGDLWDSLTMVMTSANPTFRLVHIDPQKSDKYFPIYFEFNLNGVGSGSAQGNYMIDCSPTIFTMPMGRYHWAGGNLIFHSLDISENLPESWNGTYYTYLRMQFFANYGSEQVELEDAEITLNFFVHYKSTTVPPSGHNYVTALTVLPFPVTSNIDIQQMQTFNSEEPVAGVSFASNDKRPSANYKIVVSPGENPTGNYAFHKVNGSSTPIPYKVRVPSRVNYFNTGSFNFTPSTQAGTGYWQDFFDIVIGAVNYTNVPLCAGKYQSRIKVELIYE